MLRLCFLRIGERIAAAQFAVESNERFWLLKIGYDEAFGRCSPGNLLMRETVRYAASRGLLSYEFLGAPEQWTRMWTDQIRPCVSIRAYPARARGVAALAADVVQASLRKLSVRFGRRT
jgi:CelD/BcsL family acetyltransferase involved in cellulose biosynthesis